MAVQTKTGTLAEAEQSTAEAEQKYHAYQSEVARLARELKALDVEPAVWTGAMIGEREASKRNLTKANAEARAQLISLQRAMEAQQATVRQMRARVKELPALIARLQRDLTKEGRFGIELYKAEQAVIIVHNQLKSYELNLWRMEDEYKALTGE